MVKNFRRLAIMYKQTFHSYLFRLSMTHKVFVNNTNIKQISWKWMIFTGQYLVIHYAQLAVNLVQSFGQNRNFPDAYSRLLHKIFLRLGKKFHKSYLKPNNYKTVASVMVKLPQKVKWTKKLMELSLEVNYLVGNCQRSPVWKTVLLQPLIHSVWHK